MVRMSNKEKARLAKEAEKNAAKTSTKPTSPPLEHKVQEPTENPPVVPELTEEPPSTAEETPPDASEQTEAEETPKATSTSSVNIADIEAKYREEILGMEPEKKSELPLFDTEEEIVQPPENDFSDDSMLEPPVEKDYTSKIQNPEGTLQEEYIMPPIIDDSHTDYTPPQPGNAGGGAGSGSGGTATLDDSNLGKEKNPSKKEKNPEYADLSRKQKLESAELVADMILDGYCEIVPYFPIKISSFNMQKLEIMHMDGKINLQRRINAGEGWTTAIRYMEEHNGKVKRSFTYSTDRRNRIREPLIKVLMEKEVAVTPTQELIGAVVMDIYLTFKGTMELSKECKEALAQIIKFHEEDKEEALKKGQILNPVAPAASPVTPPAEPAPAPAPESTPPVQEQKPKQEPAKPAKAKSNNIGIEDVVDFTETKNSKDITVSEVLTAENGDITVTEEK